MKRDTAMTTISYSLSILFVYAATAKTMDYTVFVADIAKSPLLVNFNNTVIAPVLLGLEFLTAVLLQFKKTHKIGFYFSSFLMLMFTLYLCTLYFFYTNIPCSCGGILGKMPYPVHIVFNLVFTLLSFTGIFLSSKSPAFSSTLSTPSSQSPTL
ncbi:MauE/DoxX family redox-associated membrane protein [Flavitalea flava]